MTYVTQPVAVTMKDRSVCILRIITSAPLDAFDSIAAEAAGYLFSGGEQGPWYWQLAEITDELVEQQIANMPSLTDVSSWRFVEEDDIPKDRSERDTWVDDGNKIRPAGHK